MRKCIAIMSSLLILGGCGQSTEQAVEIAYPAAQRSAHVDTYFGAQVADPYRWMENLDAPEVQAWVKAENALSEPYLQALPGRQWLRNRLTELWNYERYGVPFVKGGKYFWFHNSGLQDQSVLYIADSLDGAPRVLLDPNTFSEDGTVALARFALSKDASYLAYATSDGGTDWTTWHVLDVATGKPLDDFIDYTKFTSVSWLPDSSGFFYSRYPLNAQDEADDSKEISVYFHALGTPQTSDRLVYDLQQPRKNPYAEVSEDGRFLIINIFEGYNTNAIHVLPLDSTGHAGEPLQILDQWDALYTYLGNNGELFYFQTNNNAPRSRVIALNIHDSSPQNWTEIVPQQRETLETVSLVGGRLFAQYLQDAKSQVRIYSMNGAALGEIKLPGIGSASGFGGEQDASETFYSFESFTTPEKIYRYDIKSGNSTLFRETKVPVNDLDQYRVHQVLYPSKDGTAIPMFLIHRKDIKLDGSNPTLLYGYGGFNVSLTPYYSAARMVWLELGGVYAVANLRGGGEYGEAWHLAGTKLNKQNVFDDFIAAAQWLIANKYTSSEKLAIQGGSNGGLLVGATITQRPELFAAALPAVGVLDMLRYHTASANAYGWSSDYGTSEDSKEMFEALLAYSPYHNVKKGVCYPPTLVTTADHDDRVVSWHSFKFAAAQQWAQNCDNPVLIHIETRAGHGAGKPTWMRIEEIADQYAFLVKHLAMQPPGD